jgi:hypothetical protein
LARKKEKFYKLRKPPRRINLLGGFFRCGKLLLSSINNSSSYKYSLL